MTDPLLASAHLHADIERLRAQVDLSWPRELRALQQLGLSDGMRILEVGSGPGFVTERLLGQFPHSRVTVVEADPQMSELVQQRLSGAQPTRLDVVNASISMTPLPDACCDFALARFVFQHLVVPDMAAAEILRLLRPGGRLVIVDIDDALGGLVSPSFPAIDAAFEKMHALQRQRSGDRTIGRRLWRLLDHAGFTDVDLQALVVHSDDVGRDAFRAQYAPERVCDWGLTDDEFRQYCTEFEQLMSSPEALIVQVILLASGAKP